MKIQLDRPQFAIDEELPAADIIKRRLEDCLREARSVEDPTTDLYILLRGLVDVWAQLDMIDPEHRYTVAHARCAQEALEILITYAMQLHLSIEETFVDWTAPSYCDVRILSQKDQADQCENAQDLASSL